MIDDLLRPPGLRRSYHIEDDIRAQFRGARFRAVAPVQVPGANLNPEEGAVIAFRRATGEKVEMLTPEAFTLATTRTAFKRVVDGNGYMYGIVLDFVALTAANTAAVTFTQDAPWNAYDSIVLNDNAGELINCGGYDLFIANLAGKQYAVRSPSDSSRLFTLTPGGGATGGTLRFPLRVPLGLNRRSLTGITGNQDRFSKYDLRHDVSASGTIYTTPPTTLPPVTIDKYYEYYTVPAAKSQGDKPTDQEQYPPDYGRLHFITAGDAESAPTSSASRDHYLRRVGNTIRFVAFVLRDGNGANSRADVEANLPTTIQFKIGDDSIFREAPRYRFMLMHERYGFDFPAGVFLYDVMHDLLAGAGSEVGDDYWYTQGLNNAKFTLAYGAGWAADSTIHFITDDLQEGAFAA